MVRGKFRLNSETKVASYPGQVQLTFNPVYDPNLPEDQKYCKATPTGELKMTVDNPAALGQLVLGQTYYLDLTPVE